MRFDRAPAKDKTGAAGLVDAVLSEISRLSGMSRQEIYRILQHDNDMCVDHDADVSTWGARVAVNVDVNRADSYPARLPQDWISVNVVPQRPGSFSSTSAAVRSRSSSPAPANESSRASRAVAN
jgi:hypothetical protein